MKRILISLILCPFSLIAGGGHSKNAQLPSLDVQIALLTLTGDNKVSSDQASYLPDRKRKEYSIMRAPRGANTDCQHTIKIGRVDFNQAAKKATIRYQVITASQPPENGQTEAAYGQSSEKIPLQTTPHLYVMASILYITDKN